MLYHYLILFGLLIQTMIGRNFKIGHVFESYDKVANIGKLFLVFFSHEITPSSFCCPLPVVVFLI